MFFLCALVAVPQLAFAEEPDPLNTGDTAWMLTASALVLLMTPGLAFFYGGLVRRKNILSVLMQCFMCMCMMTLLWVIIGYSLAFAGNGVFYGNPGQFLIQLQAVIYTLVYSGIVSLILLKVVDAVVGLKADQQNERVGLDLTEHAETAYTIVE